MKSNLRLISLFLLWAFLLQQASFAAEDLKPGRPGLSQRPQASLRLPASVAVLEDSYAAPGSGRLIYLLQDAHTNESGQLNLAKTLEILLKEEKDLRYVFLEAGSGDDSLSMLRAPLPLSERKRTANALLKKGLLHGEEYLDLTGDRDFRLWGVEDMTLYRQALDAYRRVFQERERFELHLKKIERAVDTLKPRLLNPSLLAFDEAYRKFLEEKIPLTDYFDFLAREARKRGAGLSFYPHLNVFNKLREKESRIDFRKAGQEQARAIRSLSPRRQKELLETARAAKSPFRLSAGEHKEEKAFYALLEEGLAGVGGFEELRRYFDYLKEARKLDPQAVLNEQNALEAELFEALARTPDEKELLRCDRALRHYRKLFDLSLTPEEFEDYRAASSGFGFVELTGFLNRKIMDLQVSPEKAAFLEQGFDEIIRNAEAFYTLTRARDEAFLGNALAKMALESQTKAVLIAGGYHAPGLRRLLRRQNVSYASIVPQVFQETNRKRYESLLLSQEAAPPPPSGAVRPMRHMARLIAILESPHVMKLAGANAGARLAIEAKLRERAGKPVAWKPLGHARAPGWRTAIRALLAVVSASITAPFLKAQEPAAVLEVGTVSANSGSDVVVPVYLHTNSLSVAGFQLDLQVPAGMNYVSGTVGDAGNLAAKVGRHAFINADTVRIIIGGFDDGTQGFGLNNSAIETGVVLELTFRPAPLLPGAPDVITPISVTATRYTDPSGFSVASGTNIDGLVRVTAPPNTAPSITPISNVSIPQNSSTGAIPFTILDAQSSSGILTLSATSGNPALLPVGNIVFAGAGANRTVTLTPIAGQSGSSAVTITVSDGYLPASTSFVLNVPPPATPGVPTTLLTTQTPAEPDRVTAGGDYNLGMRFRSTEAGQITAIRFWKNPLETGTHVGRIYSASGTLLASATFTNETTSGWQQQFLAGPLSIAANTTYVVAVNTTNARFVSTIGGLSQSITNGTLSTVVGNNGVYVSSATAFPTNVNGAPNYFRDVVFVPGAAPTDTVAPSVPGGLSGSAVSSTQINLSWAPSTDNSGTVTAYRVFRNGALAATTAATSYGDNGLTPSTAYFYRVSAVDPAGNESAQSAVLDITTPAAPDTTPPSAPSGLSASAGSPTSVSVSWQPSSDNVGVAGYSIYRNGTAVGISPTASFTDNTASPSTTYTYTVVAHDNAGNTSAQSAGVSVTTPATPGVPTTLLTTQTPAEPDRVTAGGDYNLGMRFRSTEAGQITAIRFWKNPLETGTHVGRIYSASGTLLASATFTNETTSGWQQQFLAGPLSIAANTTYVVAVNTTNARFVSTIGGLSQSITNGTLSTVVGNNGVYVSSPTAFPTNVNGAPNYFRDPVFVPDPIAKLDGPAADDAVHTFLAQAATGQPSLFRRAPAQEIAVNLDNGRRLFNVRLKNDGEVSGFLIVASGRQVFVSLPPRRRVYNDDRSSREVSGSRLSVQDLVNTALARDAEIFRVLAGLELPADTRVLVSADLGIFGDTRRDPTYLDIFALQAYQEWRLHRGGMRFAFESADPELLAAAGARLGELAAAYPELRGFRDIFSMDRTGLEGYAVIHLTRPEAFQRTDNHRYLPVRGIEPGEIWSFRGLIRLARLGGGITIQDGKAIDPRFREGYEKASGRAVEGAVLKEIVQGTASVAVRALHALKALRRADLSFISQWARNMLALSRSA